MRLRNAPLGQVHLAGLVRVELGERLLELRGHHEVRQVLVAAGDEELLDLVLVLDGMQNLFLRQRAGVVLVHHDEHVSGGVEEARAELLVGGGGRALAPLALVGELLEALLEAAVDRLLPCAQINR